MNNNMAIKNNKVSSVVIIIDLVIVVILLLSTILYYYKIVVPNAKLSLFRIRRPKFVFLCQYIFLIGGIIRISSALIFNKGYISWFVCAHVFKICTYYGANLLVCIRAWLLYYDQKSARKQQQNMLTKHLSSTEIMAAQTKFSLKSLYPFSYSNNNRVSSSSSPNKRRNKHSHIGGKYQPLLIIAFIVATIFLAADLTSLYNGYRQLSQVQQNIYTFKNN